MTVIFMAGLRNRQVYCVRFVSPSWILVIEEQRRKIERRLKKSPSLKHNLPEIIGDAVISAERETNIKRTVFPSSCPWSFEGQAQALLRAKAYEDAGADMILIHSKQKTPDEVEAFTRDWDGRSQIVLIPTTYPQMTVEHMRELGKIGMVIYGNHAIRASVTAMKTIFARIRTDGGIGGVNADIVSVEEIFRLQRMDQLKADEAEFLR